MPGPAADSSPAEPSRVLDEQEARLWFSSAQHRVRTYLDTVKSVLNATASVNQLPNELLVDVLHLASGVSPRSSKHYGRLIRLTAVCRYWRDVALASSRLWTDIDIDKNMPFVALCLQRSGNASIDVYETPRWAVLQRPLVNHFEVLSTIVPHANRIRSIKLVLPNNDIERILSMLNVRMPRLEEIWLNPSATRQSDRLSLPLPFDTPFPHLQSLLLKFIIIPSTSPMLVGLRSLHLTNSLERSATSLDSILNILDNCPDLEELFMAGCGPTLPADMDRYPQPQRLIRLPRLRSLTLHNTSMNVSYLLAHLDLPEQACLQLAVNDDIDIEEDPFHSTIASVLPRDTSRVGCLAAVDHLDLYFFDRTMDLTACTADSTRALSIELSYRRMQDRQMRDIDHLLPKSARELGLLFAAAPVTSLELSGDRSYMHDHDWIGMLLHLPRLARLHVAGHGAVTALFIALLFSPEHERPVVPCLTDLVVDSPPLTWEDAQLILMCLERRSRRGARLKTLSLWCSDVWQGLVLDGEVLEYMRENVDELDYSPPSDPASDPDA